MCWPLNWLRRRKPRKIGLALGGGGARGAAHVGVLRVLEREGIRPDCVVGVSAGSVVGAAYCAGLSVAELEEIALDLQWTKLGRIVRPRLGFFDSQRLESYMTEIIGDLQFSDLSIPFAAVAADILTGQLVVLKEGSVAWAVRASCALPGIFTPVERGDQLLVDGGTVNNLPVSVAQEMGADYIMAVDLLPPVQAVHPRPQNLFEMWSLSLYTLLRVTHAEGKEADCLIAPAVGSYSIFEFSKMEEMLEEGVKAAEAKVDQIKADLGL
jgi:NTE family protein